MVLRATKTNSEAIRFGMLVAEHWLEQVSMLPLFACFVSGHRTSSLDLDVNFQ